MQKQLLGVKFSRSFLSAFITAARFRRRAVMQNSWNQSLTHLTDYRNLIFLWSRNLFRTRKVEVLLTKFP